MKARALVLVCGAGILGGAAVLIGAGPAAGARLAWEYGVYIQSPGHFEWQYADQQVRGTGVDLFFRQMGLPNDIEAEARTGRVQTVVLNHLGRQGWELVDVTVVSPEQNIYWLKRPQ